ncbi:unnamed protein product [Rotaria sp. Silwood2]|nr:unnamed protein product [Rotaria sp. Silwood2]CAF2634505.1 unnamed protein product [Rotaria sp. Silwood2]CAF2884284.1 unnamed protein product [Rotaria sp. Silwood2]CAF3105325.1 unnamed protein product [Rotaria sp. Silwood2]
MGKCAFVTVGTTQFDQLIETIVHDSNVLQTLVDCLHVDKLILQIDSIENDIQQADIVISHAGAGTILQTLEIHKPLLVVVNEKLMNNHQLEIAHEMEQQGYLFHCTCSTLATALKKFVNHEFKQYEKGNPLLFGQYLDQIMS